MYKDFKKWIKGELHIFVTITICLRLRQIRELSKLPSIILILYYLVLSWPSLSEKEKISTELPLPINLAVLPLKICLCANNNSIQLRSPRFGWPYDDCKCIKTGFHMIATIAAIAEKNIQQSPRPHGKPHLGDRSEQSISQRPPKSGLHTIATTAERSSRRPQRSLWYGNQPLGWRVSPSPFKPRVAPSHALVCLLWLRNKANCVIGSKSGSSR